MATVTLTDAVDGTTANASLINNNNSALETALNGGLDSNNFASGKIFDPAKIQQSGAVTGQVLAWNGTDWENAYPVGYEFAEEAFTADVSVTATAEASADTIVTADAVTFDGSTVVEIIFYAPWWEGGGGANVVLNVWLYDGSSSIGRLTQKTSADAAGRAEGQLNLSRRLTPSAAAHTYGVRATVVSNSATIKAGAGGSGATCPGYIRIVKVA